MKTRTVPKPRNPVARQLRAPAFRKQIVRSATTYRRKERGARAPDDTGQLPRAGPLRAPTPSFRRTPSPRGGLAVAQTAARQSR